ncbi:MAG: VTT domain-containing protein [Nocardiopsaceae bacterium]|nr:VTT domain-containing protein [Nocardiopsaceae bacterium]
MAEGTVAESTGAESTGAESTGAESTGAEGAAGEASPWDDPRLPWSGKPGRADIICWAGIVASGFFYLALLPFRAALVGTHPLLGTFLNGGTESIVAASAFARVGRGSLAVVVLLAIPGLMKFDLLYWWAGRLWGERVVLLLSGQRKRGAIYLERVHRWGPRFSWPAIVLASVLPVPSTIIYVIAGTVGMSMVTFLILDVIGSLLWIGMLAGLGYALGQHAVNVAQTISHYGLWITLGLIAIVLLAQFRSVRMHR